METIESEKKWRVGIQTSHIAQCPTVESDEGTICHVTGPGLYFHRAQASAERIVKAVNMHDDLIRTIEQIRRSVKLPTLLEKTIEELLHQNKQ